jgi:hypothetical protein
MNVAKERKTYERNLSPWPSLRSHCDQPTWSLAIRSLLPCGVNSARGNIFHLDSFLYSGLHIVSAALGVYALHTVCMQHHEPRAVRMPQTRLRGGQGVRQRVTCVCVPGDRARHGCGRGFLWVAHNWPSSTPPNMSRAVSRDTNLNIITVT